MRSESERYQTRKQANVAWQAFEHAEQVLALFDVHILQTGRDREVERARVSQQKQLEVSPERRLGRWRFVLYSLEQTQCTSRRSCSQGLGSAQSSIQYRAGEPQEQLLDSVLVPSTSEEGTHLARQQKRMQRIYVGDDQPPQLLGKLDA